MERYNIIRYFSNKWIIVLLLLIFVGCKRKEDAVVVLNRDGYCNLKDEKRCVIPSKINSGAESVIETSTIDERKLIRADSSTSILIQHLFVSNLIKTKQINGHPSFNLFWYKEIWTKPKIRSILMVLDEILPTGTKHRYILLLNLLDNKIVSIVRLADNRLTTGQRMVEKTYTFAIGAFNRVSTYDCEESHTNKLLLRHLGSDGEQKYLISIFHIVLNDDGKVM